MLLSKQFTRREKVLLVILSLLLIGAAYFFGVHRPVTEALEKLYIQQADAEAQITVLDVKERRMSEMEAELEAIFAMPNTAETPKYDNLQQLMLFLNAILASTSDYDLNFQPVQAPEDGRVVRRVIDMTFTSPSYTAARAVVEDLRDCTFRCQLGALTMAPAGTENLTEGAVQVKLQLTFFEAYAG